MSEFSESYHLKSKNPQDAVLLLQKANKKGYVFNESDGWVSFVVEGDAFIPNQSLISSNEGILFHFINAEDHGWEFTIYDKDKQISHYSCFWEEDISIDSSALNIEVISEILQWENEKTKDIKDILFVQDINEAFEKNVASSFAELMGLKNYEWISYDYVSGDTDSYTEQCPGIIEV